jgi:hypothetical protein
MEFEIYDVLTDKRLGAVEAEDEDQAVELWCAAHPYAEVWAAEKDELDDEEEDVFVG